MYWDQSPFLLNRLLSQPDETEWLEFKANNVNPQEMGEYISALSNSACLLEVANAYLVYGVADKTHEIVGTDLSKSSKKGNEEIVGWLAHLLEPRIDFRFEELEVDGKRVVIFTIDAARDRPVSFAGTAWIRVGSSKRKLKDYPEKQRKIWLHGEQTSFEDDTALANVVPEDVLQLLSWDSYFKLSGNRMPGDSTAILDRMEEDGLIDSTGSYYDITNLGALLFARQLSDFGGLARKAIRVISYDSDDRLKAIREQEGVYGYAVGFEGLISYIDDRLPSTEELGRALRTERRAYPIVVMRELVANALIHQDLAATGTSPVVEIFQTRVEITNPGRPLIDTLRFIDQAPRSRNEKLAGFMRRMRICEERGVGIDRVIDAVEEAQLPPPLFEQGPDHLRATVYAHRPLREMTSSEKQRACYQHCVMKYLAGETMSNGSLRERLQVAPKNYSAISRIISDSISKGLIKLRDPQSKSKKHARYVPFWAVTS